MRNIIDVIGWNFMTNLNNLEFYYERAGLVSSRPYFIVSVEYYALSIILSKWPIVLNEKVKSFPILRIFTLVSKLRS